MMKKSTIAGLSLVAGAVTAYTGANVVDKKRLEKKDERINKFRGYYNMLIRWIGLIQQGKNLSEYFVKNGISTIAIYGFGEVGKLLYDELRDTEITVKYAIDKCVSASLYELDVVTPDDELDTVEIIVVTAVFAFNEICGEMSQKTDIPMVPLDEIIYGMY